MRNRIMMILALFVVMAAMTGIVGAEIIDIDPVLMVVPENPTAWIGTNPDPLLDQTIVKEVTMGTTFTGNILIFNYATYNLPKNGGPAPATEVDLKFFVKDAADAANIKNIHIGLAQGIQPLIPNSIIPNTASYPSENDSIFTAVSADSPVPAGFGAIYRIGTIPYSGGMSQHGNPQPNVGDLHPELASYYVKVPFTITYYSTPRPGFVLYIYAENQLGGNDWAHTAYSHDGGYSNQIPEFPTVALPIAAVIGLVFFFQHRKKKEE